MQEKIMKRKGESTGEREREIKIERKRKRKRYRGWVKRKTE